MKKENAAGGRRLLAVRGGGRPQKDELFQQGRNALGTVEKIALLEETTQLLKGILLVHGFHAFGDNGLTGDLGDSTNHLYDFLILRVGNLGDEQGPTFIVVDLKKRIDG